MLLVETLLKWYVFKNVPEEILLFCTHYTELSKCFLNELFLKQIHHFSNIEKKRMERTNVLCSCNMCILDRKKNK